MYELLNERKPQDSKILLSIYSVTQYYKLAQKKRHTNSIRLRKKIFAEGIKKKRKKKEKFLILDR